MLKGVYSAFRFIFEILSVFCIGYWGFQLRNLGGWRFVIGIAAPAVIVFVWAMWGAPSAANRLQGIAHFFLELTIYLIAAVCLYLAGHKYWAIAYGLIGVANVFLHHFWLPQV